MTPTDLPSFAAGITWLRDHADGLIEAPIRLHDHAVDDGGAPQYSAAFYAILLHGPYATTEIREQRDCTLDHPHDAPTCERCGGVYTYVVTREVYRHPLAAALERLKHVPATSPSWPTPYQLCLVLLHTGDLGRAAEMIERPVTSADERSTLEAAFLLALRKLASRYASGPVPKMAKAA